MLSARVARLERTIDVSPEGRHRRLMDLLMRDAVTQDCVVRMHHIRQDRYRGATDEEYLGLKQTDPDLRGLMARFAARARELEAGAPLKTDDDERWRRRADKRPMPEDEPGAAP